MSGIVGDNIDDRSGVVKASAGGATVSSSDPAVDTNPADGVGTQWANSTSGEFFVCTDATTDENVWTNVGAGTGDVAPWTYQGTQYGYMAGGQRPSIFDIIDKFTFASDADATDVGNLTVARYETTGHSAADYGFASGGNTGSVSDVIDKWATASDADATDVGNLTAARKFAGCSTSSTHGYKAGGNTGSFSDVIDKFAKASIGNATNVGDTIVATTEFSGGQNSDSYGYLCGGYVPPSYTFSNMIQKYSFSVDADSTDVGNLSVTRERMSGQSSLTYGYNSGGTESPYLDVIDKFAFASDGDATDVGNITGSRNTTAGQSSTTYGYVCGGYPMSDIEKFAFASDGNAADVADLTTQRRSAAGAQY